MKTATPKYFMDYSVNRSVVQTAVPGVTRYKYDVTIFYAEQIQPSVHRNKRVHVVLFTEDLPDIDKYVGKAELKYVYETAMQRVGVEYAIKAEKADFKVGDFVRKVGGDYQFEGYVVMVGNKYNTETKLMNGPSRLVVQDDRRSLHVFSPANLEKAEPTF